MGTSESKNKSIKTRYKNMGFLVQKDENKPTLPLVKKA